MALPSHLPNAPQGPVLKSHRGGDADARTRTVQLPNGRCNFTNLNIGAAASAQCGCQRFWSRSGHTISAKPREVGVADHDQSDWCMCDHHACFHETQPSQVPRSVRKDAVDEAIHPSQHSKGREQSQPSVPQNRQPTWSDLFSHPRAATGDWDMFVQNSIPQADGTLPDTFRLSNYINSGSAPSEVPPIPLECLLPPGISSGGFSGEPKSFSSGPCLPDLSINLPPETPLSAPASPNCRVQQISISNSCLPDTIQDESFAQSATDIINPSPRSSPDLALASTSEPDLAHPDKPIPQVPGIHLPPGPGWTSNSPHLPVLPIPEPTQIAIRSANDVIRTHTPVGAGSSSTALNCVPSHLQAILKEVKAFPTLKTNMANHERRIDLLENASYSNADIEEANEKIDVLEGRLCDLETEVDELKKTYAAISDGGNLTSFPRGHPLINDNSMKSETSSAGETSANHSEILCQLETMQFQIQAIHAAIPSPLNPCDIEVIFLPFGPEMKGIWSTIDQFPTQRSRQNSVGTNDWTQTQSAGPQALLDEARSGQQNWEARLRQDSAHDWLFPRACASGSKIEERLRSRGLVKTLQITSMDSRVVRGAMATAFGDLCKVFSAYSSVIFNGKCQEPDYLSQYHGLQSPWIPLRKIHKDSRLRFLDPAEMLTPTSWNTTFLLSSVAMLAAGAKRLYITHREGYLQSTTSPGTWTWQRLRELPRVYPDVHSSAEVLEADAMESCWAYDERLDQPPSIHSSFRSYHSSLSIRTAAEEDEHSKSSQSFDDELLSVPPSPIPSTTPTSLAIGRPISPLLERHVFRPPYTRTNSMPAMTIPPSLPSPQLSGKRRIASFDYDHHQPSPPGHCAQSSPTRASATLQTKRQRVSRSPSRPRDTPQWSIGPPSPLQSDEFTEIKRGNTPFAYATPHSNTTYVDVRARHVTAMFAIPSDDLEIGGMLHYVNKSGESLDAASEAAHQAEEDIWEGVEDELADNDDIGDVQGSKHKALPSEDSEEDSGNSDTSSQPSEYPSTQPRGPYIGRDESFYIPRR
ncbi:MAG: hypothetical protein M1818_003399 [Claussenomyces sp. TS43310]|nr:MAG: hypothetical protein M1818_003399 [Claussenomyces sp. TS43310]